MNFNFNLLSEIHRERMNEPSRTKLNKNRWSKEIFTRYVKNKIKFNKFLSL